MTKLVGLACVAMVGVFGACGGSDSGDAGGTAGRTGQTCSTLPAMAPLTAATRIGFVQLYEASGLWRTANTNSIVDEAAKRGYTLVYNPGTTDAAQEQISRIQALIDARVDALIIAPHDETTIAPMVVAARKACIPVFIEDRGVDNTVAIPGVDYVTLIGSDMVTEGVLTAAWLIDKTGGKAKIIEFEGTIGSSAALGRKKGFDAEIAKHSPGMEILTSQSADFDVKTGYDLALQLLPKYPTVDWIFSHNDGMSFGIIQAMQELRKVPGQDIGIVSIDGTRQGAQYVADGLIAEITECNPKFGPLVFDTIEKYARGEAIPTSLMNTDRTFDSTNIASYLPEAF